MSQRWSHVDTEPTNAEVISHLLPSGTQLVWGGARKLTGLEAQCRQLAWGRKGKPCKGNIYLALQIHPNTYQPEGVRERVWTERQRVAQVLDSNSVRNFGEVLYPFPSVKWLYV